MTKKYVYGLVCKIIGENISESILREKLNRYFEERTVDKIGRYLEDNVQMLSSKLSSLNTDSKYGRLGYLVACIRNNTYERQDPLIEPNFQYVRYDLKYSPRKRKKTLDEYIEEYEDGDEI